MATEPEQLPLSSKKRKRNQEEEVASSGGGSTQKIKMDARRADEQGLFTEVLRTTAVPMMQNGNTWLSIDLWIAVTDAYNARAGQLQVPQRDTTSLIRLGRMLRFCNCKRSRKYCNCIIPEFPNLDSAGEPSSQVSLGSTFVSNNSAGSTFVSNNSALADNTAAHHMEYISSELMRFQRLNKITWAECTAYSDAWERELQVGVMQDKMFANAKTDMQKLKLNKIALLRMGIRSVTVSDVKCFDDQGICSPSSSFSADMLVSKIKMEMVVSKNQVEEVIQNIIVQARVCGDGGDKIFLMPVADVIRISTGERGEKAEPSG